MQDFLTSSEVVDYLLLNYPDLNVIESWGETTLFYNPNNLLKRGTYFATIKENDGPNDQASKLSRQNVYRVNFGIGKDEFLKLFDIMPKRPEAGNIVDMPYDFAKLNRLLPHPVYAWMGWVSILKPTKEELYKLSPLFDVAYTLATEKYLINIKKKK